MIDLETTNIGSHAILITTENQLILQQRDDKPGITNPGLISLFGGTLMRGEEKLNGMYRELEEELTYDFHNNPVQFLTTLYKTKALDGVDYTIHVFLVKNVEIDELVLMEGKALIVDTLENLMVNEKLTRITVAALNYYKNTLL